MYNVAILEGLSEVLEIDEENLAKDVEFELDSLALITLIAIVDEEYNITLDTEKITTCRTMSAIDLLIKSSLKNE